MLTKQQLEEMELCMIEENKECWNCSCALLNENCDKVLFKTTLVLQINNEALEIKNEALEEENKRLKELLDGLQK